MELKIHCKHIITNFEETKLLLKYEQDKYYLPEHDKDMAEEIYYELKKITGLDTTLLYYIEAKENEEKNTEEITFLSVSEENLPFTGFVWVNIENLNESFIHGEYVQKWLTELRGESFSVPWLNKNWFRQAKDYICSVINVKPEQISQYYVSPISCLLKIKAGEGDIFCKRVLPGVFRDEPRVTQKLYDLAEGNFPEILLTDNENGYIFTRDFGKNVLGKSKDFNHYLQAVKDYARLQIKMADKKSELLKAGMFDRSLSSLPGQLKELLLDDKRLFLNEENCITSEERELLLGRLQLIGEKLKELASFGLPETIEHGDLHSFNINVRNDEIIFYDWSDCAISHPFFSMRVFLWRFCDKDEQPKKSFEHFPEIEYPYKKLVAAYLDEWKKYGSKEELSRAFNLAMELSRVPFSIQYGVLVASMEEHTQAVYKYHISKGLKIIMNYEW